MSVLRDVLYQYDGTFDGFLCCIHDSYLYKEIPVGFSSDGDFLSLYEVRIVPTQAAHSQRVYRGLAARSNKAAKAVYRGFLTCMEDKELRLYAFVRKVFREGDRFMRNLLSFSTGCSSCTQSLTSNAFALNLPFLPENGKICLHKMLDRQKFSAII